MRAASATMNQTTIVEGLGMDSHRRRDTGQPRRAVGESGTLGVLWAIESAEANTARTRELAAHVSDPHDPARVHKWGPLARRIAPDPCAEDLDSGGMDRELDFERLVVIRVDSSIDGSDTTEPVTVTGESTPKSIKDPGSRNPTDEDATPRTRPLISPTGEVSLHPVHPNTRKGLEP